MESDLSASSSVLSLLSASVSEEEYSVTYVEEGVDSSIHYQSSSEMLVSPSSISSVSVASSILSDLEQDEMLGDQGMDHHSRDIRDSLLDELDPSFIEPLYPGADITRFDSCVLLQQFSLKHSLTKRATTELLTLIEAHVPHDAKTTTSLYKFRKLFDQIFADTRVETHHYCSECQQLLLQADEACCQGCDATVRHFISVPLAAQLKRKIEDPTVWKLLQSRFNRNATEGVISDILDGDEYKKHANFLSKRANVSFLLNTDGVEVFKSSSYSVWPIWLVINELPPTHRFSKRNMLLAGLWFDTQKPTMTTFLSPLMDSIDDLYRNGVNVTTPAGPDTARAVMLLSSVDLLARAPLLNMKLFNGKHGCSYCEDEGVPRATSHLQRNWPWMNNTVERTDASFKVCMRIATTTRAVEKGVKGVNIFVRHRPFDVVKGFIIDPLHCLFAGIVVNLLAFWFDSAHNRAAYSIRRKISECETRLLSIKVPDCITRPPRKLAERAKWKASERRSWLLLYSVPVLFGILPDVFFQHWCLLVTAVHLLYSDHITTQNLDTAQTMLLQFYRQLTELYGPDAATMNAHLLRHLSQCVRSWGPLWAYSCFPFESMNGKLKMHFHGCRNMSKQLAFSYVMSQLLPQLKPRKDVPERLQHTTGILFGTSQKSNMAPLPGGSNFSLGKVHWDSPTEDLRTLLAAHRTPAFELQTVGKFYRAVTIDGMVLYSKEYKRVKARNSYCVMYSTENSEKFGLVQYFITVSSDCFAVLKPLEPNGFLLSSIVICVSEQPELCVISIQDIVTKCLYIDFGFAMYVVKFPRSTHLWNDD